jgi:Rieske Fe-S protein
MSDTHRTPPPPSPERRKFLKWVTHGLGALFGAMLGVPAVLYLIDPRNRPTRASDFKPVGKLSDLEKNVPKQVVIRDVRQDAWTVHPNDVIGRVWLVLYDDGKSPSELHAYTTICPHLGCSVDYNAEQKLFVCPCHNGTFNLLGEKQEKALGGGTNPAPRDMDSLEVDKEKLKEGFIEVKYEKFYQGHEEKIPKK